MQYIFFQPSILLSLIHCGNIVMMEIPTDYCVVRNRTSLPRTICKLMTSQSINKMSWCFPLQYICRRKHSDGPSLQHICCNRRNAHTCTYLYWRVHIFSNSRQTISLLFPQLWIMDHDASRKFLMEYLGSQEVCRKSSITQSAPILHILRQVSKIHRSWSLIHSQIRLQQQ